MVSFLFRVRVRVVFISFFFLNWEELVLSGSVTCALFSVKKKVLMKKKRANFAVRLLNHKFTNTLCTVVGKNEHKQFNSVQKNTLLFPEGKFSKQSVKYRDDELNMDRVG